MKRLLAVVGAILLLCVATFCAFGFLASFEPTNHPEQHLAFQVAYAIIGLGCSAGIVLLIKSALAK